MKVFPLLPNAMWINLRNRYRLLHQYEERPSRTIHWNSNKQIDFQPKRILDFQCLDELYQNEFSEENLIHIEWWPLIS